VSFWDFNAHLSNLCAEAAQFLIENFEQLLLYVIFILAFKKLYVFLTQTVYIFRAIIWQRRVIKRKPNCVHRTRRNGYFVNRIYGLVFVKKMQVFPTRKNAFSCWDYIQTLLVSPARFGHPVTTKEFRIIKLEISKFHVCYETNTLLMKQQFVVTHTIPQNEITRHFGYKLTLWHNGLFIKKNNFHKL
jgi:NADH:ubiquinone oxidoreductase subunit 5 (subunit L)/multisubunit Na+/H+ antiporter MnhA subunit